MDASSVKTLGDFYDFIQDLIGAKVFNGSLEEYLRALWGILKSKGDAEPSWAFFAQSFQDAFTAPIVEFDEAWMAFDEPVLDNNAADEKFLTVEKLILFQIADLRRMKMAKTFEGDPELIWMGVVSPSQRTWQNVQVFSFLEAASRWIQDAASDLQSTECEWFDLVLFLHLGRIYE